MNTTEIYTKMKMDELALRIDDAGIDYRAVDLEGVKALSCKMNASEIMKNLFGVQKSTRFSVVGNGCTCGHQHKTYGKALDCLDRISDGAIFCRHGKLTIQGYHTCPRGCNEPRRTDHLFDNAQIQIV